MFPLTVLKEWGKHFITLLRKSDMGVIEDQPNDTFVGIRSGYCRYETELIASSIP